MERRIFLKSLAGLTAGILLPRQVLANKSDKSSDRLAESLHA